MKANVNFEFTDAELAKFVEDQGRRVIFNFLGGLFHHLNYHLDPTTMSAMQEAVKSAVQIGLQSRQPPSSRGPFGPPPGYGYGPMGPPPSAGPGPGVSSQYPANVRPIREPAMVDRCFPVEATRNTEAGWACHGCATFNGTHRPVCRYCGHARCDAIITPPPEPAPEPAP